MTMYNCRRCGYQSKQKGDMTKHFKRKVPCPCIHSSIETSTLLHDHLNGLSTFTNLKAKKELSDMTQEEVIQEYNKVKSYLNVYSH